MFLVTAEIVMDLAQIKNIPKAAANLQPVFRGPVEDLVREYLVEQFATEGGAGGTKWAPHAPATLLYRQQPGHGVGGIGRDTDAMYQELISPASTTTTSDTYTKTSKKPYFKWFVDGTPATSTRARQPARPVFTDQSALFEQAAVIIADYIATGGQVRGAGGRFVKRSV